MNKNREIRPKTKVVVRNLPQQLAEEQFRATVEKFLDDTDYFLWDKSFNKLETRCFINFKTPDGAKNFIQKFNGHIFITPKGKEQRAAVEYAIFQKTPKKRKPDPRENTIEADAEYQKFLEELKKPVVQLPSAEEQLDKRLAETQGTEPVIVTPLMEFIRNKRAMKAQKSQQRAQGRKKKEEPAKSANKQADENVEKKRRDRGSRRKEKEEKKKEKKKEKEQQAKQPAEKQTEKPATPKQEKQNEPKPEKQPAEKQPSKKETAEDKKNRNGMWQVRQHIEPGTVAIAQREKPSTPLNKDTPPFQPGSMPHLPPFQPQAMSYQAQPFVPQFQTMIPAYYQTMVPPVVPSPVVVAQTPAVPQAQPAKQATQPTSPGNNQRKQGGRGGQQRSAKTEKKPTAKVYAPKQGNQGGNTQQGGGTGNAPGP
eukprot:CAMPEP_0168557040 /NCGR_PEP_ID=MMETSP0413-20121227/9206_1 /TAXON_ID=136452 /ORGANISM="Filamoeba nolandi, Strain NC-AS-23-1" /LENGTH=423 /DNA_ID=CAMNT_0008588031 /DNA_START=49 /DNA_END=1320 /DNA_ORIENTATION=-